LVTSRRIILDRTVAEYMSETSDYATTFALIDVDGDGLITAAELKRLMEALGGEVSDDAAAHAVKVLDTDGDGLVSLEELTAYLSDSEAAPGPSEA
jgi:Ca2+-binding EF-hand superfamily protein